jgi:glucose-6-phosphate isomerase
VIKKNVIQKNYLKRNSVKKLSKNFEKIIKEIKDSIENPNNIFNVLSDNYNFNFKIKDLKRFSKFNNLAIIGMGGSILGSEAIYNFLKKKIKKKIYFFDDINFQKILKFKKEVDISKTVFLVISKSGNTIETLSNFFSLKIIEKAKKNIIVISEKKDNTLLSLSKKFNLFYVEHKDYISGRYSVLSEVGIVPAYLMGLNISKLRKNLRKHLKKKEVKFLQDSTIKLANILQQKKITNLIFLNYSPELKKFLYWCQQLIAESLGKNKKGFFPVISNVPKDHHSLLQLYLDGPRDKLFHIFSLETEIKEKINSKKYTNQTNFLHNKSLNKVKIAQKNALIASFKKYKIPYREFKINLLNEQTLGELFSYYVLETAIVGRLIGVNPFDQPAVEQVKMYTKKLLN